MKKLYTSLLISLLGVHVMLIVTRKLLIIKCVQNKISNESNNTLYTEEIANDCGM